MAGVGAGLDFPALWELATPWERFLRPEMKHAAFWEGVYRNAVVPEWAAEAAGDDLRILVIAEDWCGDAVNIVPVLQRLAERTPAGAIRILERDRYPEVMDRYLTGTSRSIPIAIGLDAEFRELGHWGPRPGELQAWAVAAKETMPKEERYREIRKWYARDRGETSLREFLTAIGRLR